MRRRLKSRLHCVFSDVPATDLSKDDQYAPMQRLKLPNAEKPEAQR